MLYNLKIGSKLTIGFGILVLLTLIVVGFSYYASTNATRKINNADDVSVPTALASARAQANLLRMLGDVRGYLALGNPQFRESYSQSQRDFATNLNELQQLSPNFDDENRRRLTQLQATFQSWSALPPQMFDLRDDQLEREPAYKLLAIDGSKSAGNILISIGTIIDSQEQREPSRDSIDLLGDMAKFQATFASMFSALRGYVTTGNRIYRQEYEFNLNANNLAWSQLLNKRSRLTPNQESELAALARARQDFLDQIPEKLFSIIEGDRSREDLYMFTAQGLPLAEEMQQLLEQITTVQQNRLQADLDTGRAELATANRQNLAIGVAAVVLGVAMAFVFGRTIVGSVRRLTDVAEQIRAGDLKIRARVESGDEIGTLASAFNAMTNQLHQTLVQVSAEKTRADNLLEVVIPIGVALSAEKDYNRLLETILKEAMSFCYADAGILYLRTSDDHLTYVTICDDTRQIRLGGTTGNVITYPPLPIYNPESGEAYERNVAVYVAINGVSVNIPNVYQATGFDIEGPRDFDEETGYPSLLTIPLKNSRGQVLGVLQLRDAQDPQTRRIIPFDLNLQQMMESLSSLAVAALEAYIREQSLRQEIRQLRIEIDEAKRQQQVSAIVDTDFFQNLKVKAQAIRARGSGGAQEASAMPDEPTLTAQDADTQVPQAQ